jgi:hypothetical protein
MLLEKIQLSECSVNESVFLLPLLSAETSLLISLLFMSELLYEIYQRMKTRNVRGAARDN